MYRKAKKKPKKNVSAFVDRTGGMERSLSSWELVKHGLFAKDWDLHLKVFCTEHK
jgi:hypothetical protein